MTSEEAKQLKPGDVVWRVTPVLIVEQMEVAHLDTLSDGTVFIHSVHECAVDALAYHSEREALRAAEVLIEQRLRVTRLRLQDL